MDFKVFFNYLKKGSTQESIAESLSIYGKLKYVRLPFFKNTKKNLVNGYAAYEDLTIASFVLNSVKQADIDGKMIYLQPYTENYQQKTQKWK